MLVTLPFVLLLLDYWPLDRLTSRSLALRALIEKLPLAALAAASCVVTYLVQRSGGAVNESAALAIRVQMIMLGYARYLAMLVWPFDLAVRYPSERVVNPPVTLHLHGGAAGGLCFRAVDVPRPLSLRAGGLVLVPGDDRAR